MKLLFEKFKFNLSCYEFLALHSLFKLKSNVSNFYSIEDNCIEDEYKFILRSALKDLDSNGYISCLFADNTVYSFNIKHKSLTYKNNFFKKLLYFIRCFFTFDITIKFKVFYIKNIILNGK